MNKPVRFGIVGTGLISAVHADAIANTEGAVLYGAAGRHAEKAAAFAAQYGCRAYPCYRDMLNDPAIDAVSVCTSSGCHFENARDALFAGKHVLIEKPMTLNLADADTLIRLAEEKGLVIGVISQSRFSDAAQAIKAMIDSGAAGRPVSAHLRMRYWRSQEYYDSAAWRGTYAYDGGGVLMNQGIHGIDLLCYLMGRPVSVTGYSRTLVRRIEVEDTAAAALEFESGALGVIDATTCSNPSFTKQFTLGFENGTVVLDNDVISMWTVPAPLPEGCAESLAGNTSADNKKVSNVYHTREYKNFVAHLAGEEPLVMSGRDGRVPLSVILGVYESSETGKKVIL